MTIEVLFDKIPSNKLIRKSRKRIIEIKPEKFLVTLLNDENHKDIIQLTLHISERTNAILQDSASVDEIVIAIFVEIFATGFIQGIITAHETMEVEQLKEMWEK